MPVTAIMSFEEFKELINCDKPVIIAFWATWCGSGEISPIFETLSDDPGSGDVGFYKADGNEHQDISQEVGSEMPSFVLFNNGDKVDEFVGANPQRLHALVAQARSL